MVDSLETAPLEEKPMGEWLALPRQSNILADETGDVTR